MKNKKLFRKEALESTSSKQLETLMTVVTPKGWISLICIGVILSALIVWSIIGVIPSSAVGRGIFVNQEGNFIIEAEEDGIVENIFMDDGDLVEKDQPILNIKNKTIMANVQAIQNQRDLIKSQLEKISKCVLAKEKAEKKALEDGIANYQLQIERAKNDLVALYKDLQDKQKLYQKGLIALSSINTANEKINAKKTDIDTAENNILQNEVKLKDFDNLLKVEDLQKQLQQAQAQLDLVQIKQNHLNIRSPFVGKILEIPVRKSTPVKKGSIVVWGEQDTDKIYKLLIYGYFSTPENQRILPGMIAEVKLNDVDDKLYGKLFARVIRVWKFPSSTEEMFKVIGNKTLVNYLAQRQQTAPIQVLLEPLYDPNTPTGFLWTSKLGPPFIISSGSVGEVTVLLETKRPIEYVFPIFRTVKETILLMKLKNYAK